MAIDAAGRRVEAPTQLRDGSIEIEVDPAFVATAELPLVIDPVISSFPLDDTSYDNYFPDVAYDATTQRWLVAYNETAAAGDADIYYEMCNAAGSPMWGGYVNLNNASWDDHSVAHLRVATQFLLVSHVHGSDAHTIRGRLIEADVAFVGSEFFISGSEQGKKSHPSVGGDPYPSGEAFYCVAYEREYDDFDDYDVLVRLVSPDGTLSSVNYLSNSGDTLDHFPSVSKSNGGSTWTITWERHHLDEDESHIWGGRVRYDGLTSSTPFQITAFSDDIFSCVSSPLWGSQRTMVVFQRDFGTDRDIIGVVLDGATKVTERNLSTLESTWFLEDQIFPFVETDGQHFLVAYSESYQGSGTDYDVYFTDLHLTGDTLGLSQTHVNLAFGSEREGVPTVASTFMSGGQNKRYLVAWGKETTATNWDVMGALAETVEGGTWSMFCRGDGTQGACPCGNNGFPGHGCANSTNPAGALLTLNGTPSTVDDTAVLSLSGVPPVALCIFEQSMTTSPTPFGDGLGCIGASMVRLATKTASAGAASYPVGSELALHTKGGLLFDGGTRGYQVWYRNSASFCTSAAFNISNGVLVNWAR